jgi:hypothetical protein
MAVSFAPGYLIPGLIVVATGIRFWLTRGTSATRYMGWLLAAFALGVLLYYGVWRLPVAIRGSPLLKWELMPLAFVPCPLALAAAVLRFGLFDIKVVAGRSLVYTLATVGVVGG